MIENGEKWVTNLEMSRHLLDRRRYIPEQLERFKNFDYYTLYNYHTSVRRFLIFRSKKLCSYAPNALKTPEREFRLRWSPASPPSPSRALREFSSGDTSPWDDDLQHPKLETIGAKLSVREVCAVIINSACHEIRILEPNKTEKYEKYPPLHLSIDSRQNGLTSAILLYSPSIPRLRPARTATP